MLRCKPLGRREPGWYCWGGRCCGCRWCSGSTGPGRCIMALSLSFLTQSLRDGKTHWLSGPQSQTATWQWSLLKMSRVIAFNWWSEHKSSWARDDHHLWGSGDFQWKVACIRWGSGWGGGIGSLVSRDLPSGQLRWDMGYHSPNNRSWQ